MHDYKETPEQKRERLKHKELQRNPTGNLFGLKIQMVDWWSFWRNSELSFMYF